MDQRTRLEELKGCHRPDDLGAVVTTRAAPAPVGEGRAQPLTSGEQGASRVQDGEQLVADGVQHRLLALEEGLQLLVHADAEVLGIERRGLRGHTREAICRLLDLQPETGSRSWNGSS